MLYSSSKNASAEEVPVANPSSAISMRGNAFSSEGTVMPRSEKVNAS
jgi:hypothetical protein